MSEFFEDRVVPVILAALPVFAGLLAAGLSLFLGALLYAFIVTPTEQWLAPRVRTDLETGCQYLTAFDSGITPRLDGQGRHMGCKP